MKKWQKILLLASRVNVSNDEDWQKFVTANLIYFGEYAEKVTLIEVDSMTIDLDMSKRSQAAEMLEQLASGEYDAIVFVGSVPVASQKSPELTKMLADAFVEPTKEYAGPVLFQLAQGAAVDHQIQLIDITPIYIK